MRGDCLERMKEIPDASVDLILTDPPYGTTACKWDSVIPLGFMWTQVNRISVGANVIFGGPPWGSILINSNIKQFRYCWFWNKKRISNPMQAKNRPLTNIESINVFFKLRANYYPQGLIKTNKNLGGNKPGSKGLTTEKKKLDYKQEYTNYPRQLIEFPADNYGVNKFHPTQKPVALLEYLIKTYTKEGDTVLDFCMGSGSTGVAALNLKRKFIGIELEREYFRIARKRCREAIEGGMR